jgi:hypothetical protein
MMTASLARATVGAIALSVLAGCGGSADFTISETFEINGVGPTDSTQTVNLAEIAGDAWDQRSHIKDAKIKSATGYIRKIYSDNEAATATGEATISRGSATAVVAEATTPIAIDLTTWLAAKDLDGTASIVKDALKGDGILTLVTDATPAPAGSRVHIDVEVVIDVSVDWSLF